METKKEFVKIKILIDKIIPVFAVPEEIVLFKKDEELIGYLSNFFNSSSFEFKTLDEKRMFSLNINEFEILEYVSNEYEILKELISEGFFIKNISIKLPNVEEYKAEAKLQIEQYIGTKEEISAFEKYKNNEIEQRIKRDTFLYNQEQLRQLDFKKRVEDYFETNNNPKKDLFWNLIIDIVYNNLEISKTILQHRMLETYGEYVDLIK